MNRRREVHLPTLMMEVITWQQLALNDLLLCNFLLFNKCNLSQMHMRIISSSISFLILNILRLLYGGYFSTFALSIFLEFKLKHLIDIFSAQLLHNMLCGPPFPQGLVKIKIESLIITTAK